MLKVGDLVRVDGEPYYFRVIKEGVPVECGLDFDFETMTIKTAYDPDGLTLKAVLTLALRPTKDSITLHALRHQCYLVDDKYLLKKEAEFAHKLDNLVKAMEGDL